MHPGSYGTQGPNGILVHPNHSFRKQLMGTISFCSGICDWLCMSVKILDAFPQTTPLLVLTNCLAVNGIRPNGFMGSWCTLHDDVIQWKHFPRKCSFVRGIHQSLVNSPHKGQWRGALMFSLICVWINDWVNNRGAVDLRRYRTHYDGIVMNHLLFSNWDALNHVIPKSVYKCAVV